MRHVGLSFDYDAMSLWIGSFGATSPGVISRGEFGPIGVARILALLERKHAQATFFVPGHTALAYPDSVREIRDRGHEIGHHGYVHERVNELSAERETEIFDTALSVLDQVAGVVPLGYRSPSWDFTEETPRLLESRGIEYDSSLMGSDFEPYWVRTGDVVASDGPYVFGRKTSIVELPVSWMLDDFPHFEFVRGGLHAMKSPSTVYEIWLSEFEAFLRYGSDDACFVLTMHPQVIGRGSRLAMLEKLLDEMGQRSDIDFIPLYEIARHWRQSKAVPHEPMHPDRDDQKNEER